MKTQKTLKQSERPASPVAGLLEKWRCEVQIRRHVSEELKAGDGTGNIIARQQQIAARLEKCCGELEAQQIEQVSRP